MKQFSAPIEEKTEKGVCSSRITMTLWVMSNYPHYVGVLEKT